MEHQLRSGRARRWAVVTLLVGLVGWTCLQDAGTAPPPAALTASTIARITGLGAAQAKTGAAQKIQHVIVIMQENRSFDHMFGTFPGAAGIPMSNGVPTVCVPDPKTGICVKPYHNTSLVNYGGPHVMANEVADINGGKMDGFIAQGERTGITDTMGYHDYHEIPVYWSLADQFTLQDHMYAPTLSWSWVEHNYLVSGWAARCTQPTDPSTCQTFLGDKNWESDTSTQPSSGWTDITYLLHQAGVSWRYYIAPGTAPDCDDGSPTCSPVPQCAGTPEIWNPLVDFQTVQQDGEVGNVQDVANFYTAAQSGNLPAVTWIVPDQVHGDHPTASLADGQSYVQSLVNAVMSGPDWSSTAIYLTWDEWGGFYDHLAPPTIDANGYGIRVPGLLISPWAKRGSIDAQPLSFDAYLKFIEDLFLNGQRIDPATDGRPDPRPTVRESVPTLGDLANEFDFTQTPAPVVTGLPLPVGSTAGGTSVSISGADFSGATSVTFGGVPATSVSVQSNSLITAVSPPGSGAVDVMVQTPGGVSTAVPADIFTYTTSTTVTGISPSFGPPQGGTSVVISGARFTGATSVRFGSVPAASFAVTSDSQVTAVSPSGSGTAEIRVTSPSGMSPNNAPAQFVYTTGPAVISLKPAAGIPAGGTCVLIRGSGFTGATQVLFGGNPAPSFTASTDSIITAMAPAGSGTVDVQVVSPAGTSSTSRADRYTYQVSPSVTSISPTSGPVSGGTTVVIRGANFIGPKIKVQFGNVLATSWHLDSANQITVTSPDGGSPHHVNVVVITSGGTSPTSSADLFTYT